MMKWRWGVILPTVYLLAVGLATAALWTISESTIVGTLLQFGPRWVLALPAPLVLFVAVIRRAKVGVAMVLAATGLLIGPFAGLRVSVLAAPVAEADLRFRVLSLNGDGRRAEPEQIPPLIARYKPDIVLLQGPGRAGQLRLYPDGWFTATSPGGLQCLARFPVEFEADLRDAAFGGTDRGAARFRVSTPFGEVPIVNVHLPTPRQGLLLVLGREAGATATLQQQAETWADVSRRIRDFVGPPQPLTIVAGDFNSPPERPQFRHDWGHWTNSFDTAGTGFGHTFYTRRHRIRIDHVLIGSAWQVRHCQIGPSVGSSHRPLVVDLVPAGAN